MVWSKHSKTILLRCFIKCSVRNFKYGGAINFILADTFFIANGIGTEALAGLNIVLPLVNIINGLGWMFGVGGATLFSTTVAQKEIKKPISILV